MANTVSSQENGEDNQGKTLKAKTNASVFKVFNFRFFFFLTFVGHVYLFRKEFSDVFPFVAIHETSDSRPGLNMRLTLKLLSELRLVGFQARMNCGTELCAEALGGPA